MLMPATSYRYLVDFADVCQGKTIVEGTQIGVHDIVGLILEGASASPPRSRRRFS
jgi:uncharacterized protein (DUF433 family)